MLVSKDAVAIGAYVSRSPTSFNRCLSPHTPPLVFKHEEGSGIENVYRIDTLASPRAKPNPRRCWGRRLGSEINAHKVRVARLSAAALSCSIDLGIGFTTMVKVMGLGSSYRI